MAYQLQQQRSSPRDTSWLAMLVATFETISRDGGKPSAAAIIGLKAQLSRPTVSFVAKSTSLH